MRQMGYYQKLGDLKYFIPYPLPPFDPPLQMYNEIICLHGEASFALGQLNEMSQRLPAPRRFIKAYVIKEALLSSSIEGINTTLSEVFSHSVIESKSSKETQLVVNYSKALDVSMQMLLDDKLPLVSRIILKAHQVLMSSGEGEKSMPGNFRQQSVRVGDLVPPIATEVPRLISELEKYINEPSDIPSLIQAGLVHVQFETIHPFLDGNGRIGRLLIVLMLMHNGLLKLPICYPSYYFKKHHLEYYQKLDRVRTHGDFEGWIIYYLKAIRDSAIDAHRRALEVEKLEAKLNELIQKSPDFAKMRETSSHVLEFLFNYPVTNIVEISKGLNKAYNTIQNILQEFIKHNLISEIVINKRNKLYRFDRYLLIFEEE
jgi:Fic family protein